MIVAFVLVLRHLPRDYSAAAVVGTAWRCASGSRRRRRHRRVVRAGRRQQRPSDRRHRRDRSAVAARSRRARTSSTSRSSTSAASTRWARSPCSASLRSAWPTSWPRPGGGAVAPTSQPFGPDRRGVDDLRAGDADDLPPHAARVAVRHAARAQRARRWVRRRPHRRRRVRVPHPGGRAQGPDRRRPALAGDADRGRDVARDRHAASPALAGERVPRVRASSTSTSR